MTTALVGRAGSVAGSATFPALGTTAEVIVSDDRRLRAATNLLRLSLAEVDLTCSRFREDSEIRALQRAGGRPVRVSPLLSDALAAALRAARVSGGAVDLTVGEAVSELGYDRDFAEIVDREPEPSGAPRPAPGWWRLALDPSTRTALIPHGVHVDLGSTGKAFAADRAARTLAEVAGCGVLVNLGGDVAVAGPAPERGWQVRVREAHDCPADVPGPTVSIRSGGIATSSIVRRTWSRGGRRVHHIVDPRTGDIATPMWRTVTVAASTCTDANTASTASIVQAAGALEWLERQGLPARLVAMDGTVTTVCGWPAESPSGSP